MSSAADPLEVRPYGPADATAWDEAVGRSRSDHFLFRRAYMDYHADRFADASLLVLDGTEIVAALPANRDGARVVSHGGLTFGGLIGGAGLTTRRTVAALGAVCAHLADAGVSELVYKPVPHIYHAVPNEEDLYALFALGARLVRRDVSAALRPDPPPARTKGRRTSVRQALAAGLEVSPSTDFDAFMSLEAEMLALRHGTQPTHTGPEMALLAGRFPENITLTVARHAGELLAGVLVFATPTVAHAQYIGASARGHEVHAVDAIVDHLLTERYRDRRFFDFGISTEQDGRRLNAGLMRNKESFGARAVSYDRYVLDVREASRLATSMIRQSPGQP